MHPHFQPVAAAKPELPTSWRDSTVIRFGEFELNVPTREFRSRQVPQHVRRRVFDLMVLLISRHPAAVTHAEIAQGVWGQRQMRQAAIAQAVLEARRLIGDDLNNPSHFVTVRGVGYRFAQTPAQGVSAEAEHTEDSDLSTARRLTHEAVVAVNRKDREAALFLGEQAIQLAQRAGAHVLTARAMAAAAWGALHKGPFELAARYAYQALRLAQTEDHPLALAEAQVSVAQVLLAGGDLLKSLQMLEGIRLPDDDAENLPLALQCASLAGKLCTELKRFDEATTWLNRARHISLKCRPAARAVPERINTVSTTLKQAEAERNAGRPEPGRTLFTAALALNEALRADIAELGNEVQRLCWLGNQGLALLGLDRVDEAWQCAEETGRQMKAWAHQESPWFLAHVTEQHLLWATLYHRVGRTAEALQQLEPAFAGAQAAGRHSQAQRVALLAAKVCEDRRSFEDALRWAHRAQAAEQAQNKEQSSLLACAYSAARDHDRLMQDLQETRARLNAAQVRIQELGEQLQMVGHQAAAGRRGLLPLQAFENALRYRYEDASARDLPCLVGLLRVQPCPQAANPDFGERRTAPLEAISAEMRMQLGAGMSLICASSDSTVAFMLESVGLRRAQSVCRMLQERMADWAVEHRPVQGSWHFTVDLFDLGKHPGFEAALAALQQVYAAGSVRVIDRTQRIALQ